MISIKSKTDLAKMREAGKIAGGALKLAGESIKAGMTTLELDKIVHDYIVDVIAAVSRDFHLGSAAHAINGEADIKRTAGVLQFPQMGVFHGHVEAGRRSAQFIAVGRKNFVAEP